MSKMKILVGLQASGKSTHAYELVGKGWARVNKDDIRKLLYGEHWKPKKESKVIETEELIIKNALKQGRDVVVDSTNLNPKHINRLKRIAREFNAEITVDDSFLEVPLTELIRRDLKRPNPVGEAVIRSTYDKWIRPKRLKQSYDPYLAPAYLVDLDGTLTLGPKDRSPYDWAKVGQDELNVGLSHILDGIKEIGYAKIILLSGRDSVCRPETEAWLEHNCIDYDYLYMRPEGDNRSDVDVKYEIYNNHIKDNYTVLGVFDDRSRVIDDVWHDIGLMVFKVGGNGGNF